MEIMVWALLCVVGEDASWARHDLMPMACSDGGGVVGLHTKMNGAGRVDTVMRCDVMRCDVM